MSDLVLQRVRVYLDLGDGVRHDLTVTLDHRDMRAYTVNAKRYGLPPIPPDADMPAVMFFVTWQAWHAATREGLTELGWREWDAACIATQVIEDEPEALDAVDPTSPANGVM